MSVQQSVIPSSAEVHDEVADVLDPRTAKILEQRGTRSRAIRRGGLVRRALLATDVMGLAVAFVAAEAAFPRAGGRISAQGELALFALTLPLWIVAAKVYGLYDRDEERTDHSTVDELVSVFHLVTVGAWALFGLAWTTGLFAPDAAKVSLFWLLALALVALGRGSARAVCRRQLTYLQNTIIVGAGDVGQLVARKYSQHPEYGINLVGFVDDRPKERRPDLGHLTLLGGPDQLPALVRLLDVERVVIAFSNERAEKTVELVRSLGGLNVQIDVANIATGGTGNTATIKCTWSNFNTTTGWTHASPYIIWNALALTGSTGYHKTIENPGLAYLRFEFSSLTATYVTSYPLRVTFSD